MCIWFEYAVEVSKDTLLLWLPKNQQMINRRIDQFIEWLDNYQSKKTIKLERDSLKEEVVQLKKELDYKTQQYEVLCRPIVPPNIEYLVDSSEFLENYLKNQPLARG